MGRMLPVIRQEAFAVEHILPGGTSQACSSVPFPAFVRFIGERSCPPRERQTVKRAAPGDNQAITRITC